VTAALAALNRVKETIKQLRYIFIPMGSDKIIIAGGNVACYKIIIIAVMPYQRVFV
jgi:hypothetical protein